jgi:hypothetical protein
VLLLGYREGAASPVHNGILFSTPFDIGTDIASVPCP